MADYPVVIRPDFCTDGSFCYIAEHPDLPGCVAYAPTQSEARRLLDKARDAYLASLTKDGVAPPPPSSRAPLITEWQGIRPMMTPAFQWTALQGSVRPKPESDTIAA